MPIRTGLFYGNQPRPLLRVIGGKPRGSRGREEVEDIEDSSSEPSRSTPGEKTKDNTGENKDALAAHDDTSDDSDGPDRGSIRPTSFGSSKRNHEIHAKSSHQNNESNGGNKRRKQHDAKASSNSQKKQPNPSPESVSDISSLAPTSSGEHMLDSHGFMKKRKVTATFGSKGAKNTEKKVASSQDKGASASRKKSPEAGLRSKGRGSKSVGGFIHFSQSDDEASEKGKFKSLNGLVDSPPAKTTTEFKPVDEDRDSFTTTPPKSRKKKQDGSKPLKKATSVNTQRLHASDDEKDAKPKPVFKTFDDADDDLPAWNHSRSGSPLSDADSEASAPANEEEEEPITLSAVVCPWCGEAVDAELLDNFSKGKRMNVQQQTRFCQKHKKHTAAKTWDAKSYPTIDWDEIPDRIATHGDFLLEIIDGTRWSYYRTALAEKIKAGRDRAMKKEENLNPGYYGPRGFDIMCDNLVVRFGDVLKEKAVHDRVISGRGSAAFIQSVLVAELGVRLISEDMGVDGDRAREIMEESKMIGEMVHEDP